MSRLRSFVKIKKGEYEGYFELESLRELLPTPADLEKLKKKELTHILQTFEEGNFSLWWTRNEIVTGSFTKIFTFLRTPPFELSFIVPLVSKTEDVEKELSKIWDLVGGSELKEALRSVNSASKEQLSEIGKKLGRDVEGKTRDEIRAQLTTLKKIIDSAELARQEQPGGRYDDTEFSIEKRPRSTLLPSEMRAQTESINEDNGDFDSISKIREAQQTKKPVNVIEQMKAEMAAERESMRAEMKKQTIQSQAFLKELFELTIKGTHERKKIPKVEVPRFNGKGDLDEFLNKYEKLATYSSWQDHEKAEFLEDHLDGTAKDFVWVYQEANGKNNWMGVKTALIERFQGGDRSFHWTRKLFERVHELGENIGNYITDVQRLCRRVDAQMSEEKIKGHIMRGLKPEVRRTAASVKQLLPLDKFVISLIEGEGPIGKEKGYDIPQFLKEGIDFVTPGSRNKKETEEEEASIKYEQNEIENEFFSKARTGQLN